MKKYVRLLDKTHKNEVVMLDGKDHRRYIKDRGWVQSSIMIGYHCDESDTYDMYEEITEA
jgi:hypothetical protein